METANGSTFTQENLLNFLKNGESLSLNPFPTPIRHDGSLLRELSDNGRGLPLSNTPHLELQYLPEWSKPQASPTTPESIVRVGILV